MPIYPLFFLIFVFIGWLLSIVRDPLWGLIVYIFVYFNIPSHQWWGDYVPHLRWSLTAAIILGLSIFLHSSKYKFQSPFSIPFLRFLVILWFLMIIIVPISIDPKIALNKCYDFFRYLVISYFIYTILYRYNHLKWYLFTLLLLVLYLSYLAHHYFTGTRLDGIGLVDADAANEFAILLLTSLSIPMYFILKEGFFYKMISLISLPIILDAFAMCRSRGGFLGLTSMMFFISFIFPIKKYRLKLLLATSFTLLLMLFLMDPYYLHRILSLKSDPSGGAGRLEIWKYGLQMAKEFPFGAGGGAFLLLSPKFLPEYLLEHSLHMRASHNTFLMILVEQGILGLTIFLIALIDLFRTGFIVKSCDTTVSEISTKIVMLNSFIMSSIIGFIVASIFADRLYYEGFYLIAMIIPINLKIIKGEIKNGI